MRCHRLPRILLLCALFALDSGRSEATTYTITTLVDDLTTNGNCTLREAVQAAFLNTPVDLCPAGSGSDMDTIELGAGTYLLPLGVLDVSGCFQLRLRGPAASPPVAVLSGESARRVMTMVGGCSLILEDLEIRDGRDLGIDVPIGAGVRAVEASLTLRRVRFFGNVARRGGALAWAATAGSRHLVVEDSHFEQNRAQRPDAHDACEGGAVWVEADAGATVQISSTRFVDNVAETALDSDSARGGAAVLYTEGTGSLITLERLRFSGNSSQATGSGGFAAAGALSALFQGSTVRMEDLEVRENTAVAAIPLGGSGLAMLFTTSTQATLDRLRVTGNTFGAPADQFQISSQNSAFVAVRDTLVAAGEGGMQVSASSDGVALLSQLTVVDHSAVGLQLDEAGTGSISLVNSIVFGNGTDLGSSGSPAIFPTNLIGIDPLFVNAGSGDYRLAAGSPAEDAADTVFSGVGPYDLSHGTRLLGVETDLGAFELGALFNDGFEIESTANWSW